MLRWALAACCLLLPQDPLGDLDSPDPAVARRAFEAAIRAGDEKALEAAAKTSERARIALEQVRAHRTFGDSYPQVKLLSFKMTDKPFEKALEEIAGALGVPVDTDSHPPNDVKVVSLEVSDAYPLEAMRKFASAAGGSMWLDRGKLKFSPHGGLGSNAVIWRNFSISPDSVHDERVISPFGNTKKTHFELRVIHDGGPRLAGIKGARVAAATEDTGRSLVNEAEEPGWGFADVASGSAYPVRVALKGLSPEAKNLSLLKGSIVFLVPQEPTFVDLTLGGAGAETTTEGTQVKVEAGADGKFLVTCSILDPKKRHVVPRPSDFQVTSKEGDAKPADMAMTGPPLGPVQRWSLAAPAGFKVAGLRIRFFKSVGELSVPFEFKDIPVR